MSFIKIAGYQWSPELVSWGSPGRGRRSQLRGYDPKTGLRGRPSLERIANRTVNLWDVHAVYTLFRGNTLIYVGEGTLGTCLLRHYSGDEYVGRWDAFSWVSPTDLDSSKTPPTKIPWSALNPVSIGAKALIEHLELIVIRLAEPAGNRQNPTAKRSIKWLNQVPPEGYLTTSEKLDELLKRIDE